MTGKEFGVLAFIPHYLPGYKAGGPIRALANLIEQIGDEFQFNVVTTDRDQGDSGPYQNVPVIDEWVKVGKAEIKYLSSRNQSFKNIRRLLQEFPCNSVHLTGLFSTTFSAKIFILARLGLVKPRVLIVAPRGELSSQALHRKRVKKVVYIFICRLLGFYNNVIWHASSAKEKEDIERIFGAATNIQQANDLGSSIISELSRNIGQTKHSKVKGLLKIIFLGRITHSKNILGALEMVSQLNGEIIFNIYGPIQDKNLWRNCEKRIQRLPPNIKVSYKGGVDPNAVSEIFGRHDVFLFPTGYESFGHVVLESLSAGCPVLISDRTPWIDLEKHQAGWVVKYADFDRFSQVLGIVTAMDAKEYAVYSENAIKYAEQVTGDPTVIDAHRRLFEH